MSCVIKHLVISGGGPSVFRTLGAIYELNKRNNINLNEIKSIYGTSAGAVIGLLVSLNFDVDTIYDYMIKRPWIDVFNVKIRTITRSV